MCNMNSAAEDAKEQGNACMASADYVGAMTSYTRALSFAPKEASLFSNRSFAFLKLSLPARALADAEEAIRRRPEWPKGHFRKAEALRAAGLHEDALEYYARGAELDPSDEHLRSQCDASRLRASAQQRQERLLVAAATGAGLLFFALLALTDGGAGHAKLVGVAGLGAALGALAGVGATALRGHGRRGAVLPPLETNDAFVALQTGAGGDAAGRGAPQAAGLQTDARAAAVAADGAAGGAPSSGGTGGAKGARHRSAKNGRAAALRAMGRS